MRKLILVIVLVVAFAGGLLFGFGTPDANAGKTRCWTSCENGVGIECCRTGAIVLCRVIADDC